MLEKMSDHTRKQPQVKVPAGISKLIEGEKPINFTNKQSLNMRMSTSVHGRRSHDAVFSIYNRTSASLLVDRICPWKSTQRLLHKSQLWCKNDYTKCCKTCTPNSLNDTFIDNPVELGTCDILKLPCDFRMWYYQGPGWVFPDYFKYALFSITAKRFYYPSIIHTVFTNRHILNFLSAKVFSLPSRSAITNLPTDCSEILSMSNAKDNKIFTQNQKENLRVLFNDLMLHYRKITASMNSFVLFVFGWFLLKFLNRVFGKIIVTHAHLERLRNLEKINQNGKVPLLYLPLHKSHVDYLLLSLILWQYGLRWPHIIAGNNLQIPGISWLLSRMGAVFVRRGSSINSTKVSEKKNFFQRIVWRRRNPSQADKDTDVGTTSFSSKIDRTSQYNCYVTVLKAYIEELMSSTWPLEVFIEGGRSRTGKPIVEPKLGIISSIIESLDVEKFDDVAIVPVSISYDKVMDMSGFHNEWQGLPKQSETLWNTLKGVFAQLNMHYGLVRVNFGQPFSAREMISHLRANKNETPENLASPCDLSPTVPGSALNESIAYSDSSPRNNRIATLNSLLSIPDFKSFNSFSNSNTVHFTPKSVVYNLALHSLYLSHASTSIMSTHLVAFLLLNLHRNGVTIETFLQSLADAIADIEKGVVYSSMCLGFSGTAEEVLTHFTTLFPSLIHLNGSANSQGKEFSEIDRALWNQMVISPNFQNDLIPSFELLYLSNHVSCQLVMEAILSTTLMSLANITLETASSHHYNVFVSREKLLEDCSTLTLILSEEFIVCSPCEDVEKRLEDILVHFESCELVFREKETDMLMSANERKRQDQLVEQLEFTIESDSDTDLSDFNSDIEEPHELIFTESTRPITNGKMTTSAVHLHSQPIKKEDRVYINFEKKEVKCKLIMFANILSPVISCYWIVSLNLDTLLKQDIKYDVFLKQSHSQMKNAVDKKVVRRAESCCFELVKNAVKFFISFSVLRSYIDLDGATNLTLTDGYKDCTSLQQLQQLFEDFKL